MQREQSKVLKLEAEVAELHRRLGAMAELEKVAHRHLITPLKIIAGCLVFLLHECISVIQSMPCCTIPSCHL